MRPSTSEAPAASLPPPPLRLLPGGAIQFPGESLFSLWTSAFSRRTAIALAVGALQFSTRLRQRFPRLHRVLGRFYVAGVSIAGPVAVYLAFHHGLPTMKTETTVQASLWLVTTWMAFVAVLNRNFEVHRQWMMRSYSVTLIFVASRIILALPVVAPTTDLGAERLGWILVICALLVPQLIINWPQLFGRSRAIRAAPSLESVRDISRRSAQKKLDDHPA